MGSRLDQAAPIGATLKTKIERGDRYSAPEVYHLEITVLDVLRGENALNRIRGEDVPPGMPQAGFEYLLVRIRFGYFSRGRGLGRQTKPYQIVEGTFACSSSDGKTEFEGVDPGGCPEPHLLNIRFVPGDVREGWILLQVPEKETRPLLIFKREYHENAYGFWAPAWFRLYQT